LNRKSFLSLLRKLLVTHSPSGDESEIDDVVEPILKRLCDEVWTDEFGTIIGRVKGKGGKPTCIAAHKDEVGMLVKRIESDGRIIVENVGGLHPWKIGEGPVQILAPGGLIDGVMSVGATHTTAETQNIQKARTGPLAWTGLHIDAKMTKDELKKAGVGAGTRVVIHRMRKEPMMLRGYAAGYGLDDKAGLAIMLVALEEFRKKKSRPGGDIYFAATACEEVGAAGGAYLAKTLDFVTFLAVEVAPAEKEYDVGNSEQPVVIYKDAVYVYDKSLSDELCRVADKIGCGAQRAAISSFGSDASMALKYGQAGRAACIAFPTQNTHGYEMANIEGMLNCGRLLCEFLRRS